MNAIHRPRFDRGPSTRADESIGFPPGRHTLQLLLGDENHEPQYPVLKSEKITVRVK
ncbi:MAG: DUF4399 domain-containing protein [Candidatus Thiodiazotropha sp.]